MAAIEKRRGPQKRAPSGPRMPSEAAYLWNAFTRLSERRSGGFGPGPITYSDIAWFCAVRGERFESWEIDAIMALDDAFFEARSEDTQNG